jgi:hypothetical protein
MSKLQHTTNTKQTYFERINCFSQMGKGIAVMKNASTRHVSHVQICLSRAGKANVDAGQYQS